jgi:hypothetical protein
MIAMEHWVRLVVGADKVRHYQQNWQGKNEYDERKPIARSRDGQQATKTRDIYLVMNE